MGACKRAAPPPPAPAPIATVVTDAAPAATHDEAPVVPKYRDTGAPAPAVEAVSGSGATYMVASESARATQVGRDILAAHGNAVDAAVATAFALAVVHPTAGNLGGGGFAVVRTAPGKAESLDFRETAPAAATATMYLDAKGNPTKDSLLGARASGVPGSVAGLWELHHKYGHLTWAEVVAPAVELARGGFAVDATLAEAISDRAVELLANPATGAIWVPNRIPVAVGKTVAIPDLAITLDRIAAQGPDGFYKGETAAAIVAEMTRGGGIITAADLAGYHAVWRTPLRFSYRGYSMVTMPPPSSGGIVLALTTGMFRNVDMATLPWHSAPHVHRLIETWRRAFAVRNEVLGDPAFVTSMPIAHLMSTEYQDQLAATITDKASESKAIVPLAEGNHTTNLCVVDAQGMAVALTTTLNTSWGNGITVAGAGFLLNNEMDDFTAKPGSPNVFGLVQGVANKIEPGKRMLSSMSPTIVEDPQGNVFLLAGAGGGPRIITAVWQTISNVIDYGQTIAIAVASKRVHMQHLPDVTRIEEYAIDEATAKDLAARGEKLDWSNPPGAFAHVTAIVRTKSGWDGTSDPRGGGSAMGDAGK